MAVILPIAGVDTHGLLQHWWQWVLLSVIGVGFVFGAFRVVLACTKRAWRLVKGHRKSHVVPNTLISHLQVLDRTTLPFGAKREGIANKPTSFGTYLGAIADPPTEAQSSVLSIWELIILDPSQPGVLDAIGYSSSRTISPHIVGRLQLDKILQGSAASKKRSINESFDTVISAAKTSFRRSQSQRSNFTGILLAGWEDQFSISVFHQLTQFLAKLGFAIYLEISPPIFLEDGKVLDNESIAGVVIRNGTILTNGERRDYFLMSSMKNAVKAFVSQSCYRQFVVMLWELHDDNVKASNAVIKRSFNWCNFYSAISWIGPKMALYDAEVYKPVQEPLGAFSWLKDTRVMRIQDAWRANSKIRSTHDRRTFPALNKFIPSLNPLFASDEDDTQSAPQEAQEIKDDISCTVPEWVPRLKPVKGNPLSISPSGKDYQALGCFPLGQDVSSLEFAEVQASQKHLKSLGLLDKVPEARLQEIGKRLQDFSKFTTSRTDWPGAEKSLSNIQLLSQSLLQASDDPISPLRVYIGLGSGFRTALDSRFWAVYGLHSNSSLDIFISKDVEDFEGVIIHAYLSSRGCPRHECFATELGFARWSGALVFPCGVSKRVSQDIHRLSPEENILFLQHLTGAEVEDGDPVLKAIRSSVQEQLIDRPNLTQLKELNTIGYLEGSVSVEALISTRIAWYRQSTHQHPDSRASVAFFKEAETGFVEILGQRKEDELLSITQNLDMICETDGLDAWADLILLSFFCAARKLAFEEVYVEITDRNPLFNDQSDQAAAFAELFTLGARCEAYFDVSPSALGNLLAAKYRSFYGQKEHQPPSWVDGAPGPASAYAAAGIDIDADTKPTVVPTIRRFGFLSVFAIPALVDILLLTLTGRGLYLSAFMSHDEQTSATLALMISLLLSGAIGTWISCGGTYYLMSMAFSAMNLFVVTRLIGGIAFTIGGGVLGFVLLGIFKGFTAGIVFFLYLVALTSYFCLLAALANFEYPGSSYLSGRVIIICCVPILFVSPIITFWVPRHDTAIYLSILYIFVVFLLLGARRVGSRWMTWYHKIPQIDDVTVRDWYISTIAKGDKDALSAMTEPAALRVARAALYNRVRLEKTRNPFTRSTSDALILKLAKSFDGMIFLLDWYCKYSDVIRPIPYSSAWNIQIKVALDTLRQAQHGIRLHNAFIHWRQAGDEVGCGILYFLVALLDKWVDLLTGDPPVGLSANTHTRFRMAVGLGLAYYLTGALLLEFSAQSLHHVVDNANNVAVRSADLVNQAVVNATLAKRRLYWITLAKYLSVHIWSLTFTGTLMWVLDGSSEGVAMFVAYVGAYTGLLWYQYSKIFSGPHALKPLLMATVVALPVGITLKKTLSSFPYDSVIALALATWLAAILSFQTVELGTSKELLESQSGHEDKYHAYDPPGTDLEWSHEELKVRYDALCTLPSVDRFEVKPSDSHGMRIRAVLSNTISSLADRNVTEMTRFVDATLKAFEDGSALVELVPPNSIWDGKEHSRALSRSQNGIVHLLVEADNGALDLWSNCRIISEVLLHAVSEAHLHLPHIHSLVLESLITYEKEACKETLTNISWSLERQFRDEPTAELALAMIQYAKKQLVSQLCLGTQCDTQWHQLPSEAREILLHRCLGKCSQMSEIQIEELYAVLADQSTDPVEYVACCNFGVACAINLLVYSEAFLKVPVAGRKDWLSSRRRSKRASQQAPQEYIPASMTLKSPFRTAYHMLGAWIKFFVIALVADPEFQRELDFVLRSKPGLLSKPIKFVLSSIWVYSKFAQDVTLPFFMFHGRDGVLKLWRAARGTTTTMKRRSVIIENLQGVSTAFIRDESDSGFKVYQYGGRLKQEPEGKALFQRLYTYSKDLKLQQREDWNKDGLLNKYEYEYEHQLHPRREWSLKGHNNKIPSARRCTSGPNMLELLYYTRKGLVESGSYIKDGNIVRFKYHYSYSNELLSAEYVLPHITCNVSWCASPPSRAENVQRWIPHSKVLNATFVQGPDVWESTWTYHHKFHPDITTILNGRKADTPPMIQHDWLNVLAKPAACDFEKDNPLLLFANPLRARMMSRWFGSSTRCNPISTTQARSQLWRAWKKGTEIDGVTVRWLDEKLLRKTRVMHKYWRYRDTNNLLSAASYLDLHVDAIMATVDLENDISSWTPLALKLIDLYSFGQGGDAVLQTRANFLQSDSPGALHVMAVDTGTWPNEGGGVSACRRDMVNNLGSIKWHMVAESANDFGVPKHQIERNVESLKVIPLWGLDFLTPTHGIFQNRLDSEVHPRKAASNDDIRKNFVPILTALVKGARAITLSKADIKQATRALVNLNTYFEDYRNWNIVWTSEVVKRTWRELWLTQDMTNAKPSSEWFDTELPTITSLNTALELWFRYLFIFSIPIPKNIPTVFQASHHSVSASYGVVCKIKCGITLQIWDHAISWRETNLYLSSALCTLPPFVRNSLLGLMRVTSVLTLHHADNILPCADFFNPGWEIEIGTCQGTLESRHTFRRKVDPIVNGIPDMQKFAPITEIKSALPTVTMLSHVWYAKDIKTALLAADIIVHNWGFKDFRLNIYGALDKAPTYSAECQEILACKSLRENVCLCGTADPSTVLANTWVFLNSSISEGLPLALGEAALTGAPVVCTDVGASLRVLTDPRDGSRYSEVVAPNDANSLARAQINLLALLGEWGKYAEDPEGYQVPILTEHPTEAEVASITKRMYEKGKQRRNLGMMARTIVQQSFRGDRYLREHEQMLWIGKATNEMRENPMIPVEVASAESSRPVSVPTDYFSVAPVTNEPRPATYSSRTSYSALSLPTMTDNWGSYPASVDFRSIMTPQTNSALGTPRRLFKSRPSSGLSNVHLSASHSHYPDLEADTISSSSHQSGIVHLARPMTLKRASPTFTNLPTPEFKGRSRSSSRPSTPGDTPQAAIPVIDITLAETEALVAEKDHASENVLAGKGTMNERNFAARIAAQGFRSPGWD